MAERMRVFLIKQSPISYFLGGVEKRKTVCDSALADSTTPIDPTLTLQQPAV